MWNAGIEGRIFYISMYIRCNGRLFGKTSPGFSKEKRIPRIQLSLAFQSPKLHGVVPLKSTFGIPFMLFDKSLLRILHHLLVTVIAPEIRATTSQKRTSWHFRKGSKWRPRMRIIILSPTSSWSWSSGNFSQKWLQRYHGRRQTPAAQDVQVPRKVGLLGRKFGVLNHRLNTYLHLRNIHIYKPKISGVIFFNPLSTFANGDSRRRVVMGRSFIDQRGRRICCPSKTIA